MKTFFAPAERAAADQLNRSIEAVSNNAVVDAVMEVVAGLLAVLNEQRQILALNDTLLDILDVDDAAGVLGLRFGEALDCVHAHDEPGGCGTSRHCATCGAAIAMVASLTSNQPEQRDCVATLARDGRMVDMYFQVRCCPITFEGQRFLLLFLQDVTEEQRRAVLERVFFHDINNTITALAMTGQLLERRLQDAGEVGNLAVRVRELSLRLAKEVEMQRALSDEDPRAYQLTFFDVAPIELLVAMGETFANHPAASGKVLSLPHEAPTSTLSTDRPLFQRVLTNMLVNAFEATPEGGEVRLWAEDEGEMVSFCVWNAGEIPSDVALRVFQRNFTTKGGVGRGLGTYAMKLFGEVYLGGQVTFETSAEAGTVFRFRLPWKPRYEN
ncbi:MAG: sensor histidine kinase [Anaerolineae bacterium]|nr:sensor histidine kinase [Anaerolineae bacterium]